MDSLDLCYLSAVDLLAQYRARTLSPVEVTRAVLERMDRLNPTLNAFITVTPDLALEAASRAESAYGRGDEAQALLGVPISIKDLVPTKGIRTTRGSLLLKDWVPDFDAPLVERTYAAGAVMLGKTNTPEHGWKGETSNRLLGPAQNPWKLGRTPGGSSGGAAAAVAAGFGPIAQGSDGAGSIRIPSAFSGIFGLKPSAGLVPNYPRSPTGMLSHMGPMTRTVRDAALYLNILSGPDARDPLSLPASGVDYVAACDVEISGLRVAWSPDLGFAAVDPEVLGIVKKSVDTFREMGCHVEEISMDLEDPFPLLDVIWAAAMASPHQHDFEQVRDLLDPGRVEIIERGFGMTAAQLSAALAGGGEFTQRVFRAMSGYDLLLTPTLPVGAFPVGEHQPGEVAGRRTEYLSWTPFTYTFNLTGQPAATVPCGFTAEGLPVGLQIVGQWRDDSTVLAAAASFEEARPWAQVRPSLD